MRFYPANPDALPVELSNLDETLALFESLQQMPIAGVEEIVPAARTLLVHFRPSAIGFEALATQIASRDIRGKAREAGKLIEIPVHYNGEDLADVARELDISVEEVIKRHTGSDYNVAFCGFAPGFAYLSGGAGFVCHGAARRARVFRLAPWRWPVVSVAFIHRPAPAAGRLSG